MTSEFGIAIHALVYLNHKQTALTSEMLADNICTNPARVRKVMAKLKRAALIETRAGVEGGYRFALDARSVTLDRVCRACGDDPVSVGWRSGSMDMDCLVASGMANVMDGIYGELNAACMQHLTGISIADIDRMIFPGQ